MRYNKYILFIVLGIVLNFVWIGLEYVIDGRVVPLHSDTVMLVILNWLLTDKIHNKLYK